MARWFEASFVALLVSATWAFAQEGKTEQKPEDRPTLGPAPSLSGPRSSSISDARKLVRIRTLYVERIDNRLSELLAEGLAKVGRFRIVANRNEADGVLRGTCFDSRRLKSVHSEVFLTERSSGASVWQDIVRRPYNPPPLEKAVNETALTVVKDLAESVQEAQRK